MRATGRPWLEVVDVAPIGRDLAPRASAHTVDRLDVGDHLGARQRLAVGSAQ